MNPAEFYDGANKAVGTGTGYIDAFGAVEKNDDFDEDFDDDFEEEPEKPSASDDFDDFDEDFGDDDFNEEPESAEPESIEPEAVEVETVDPQIRSVGIPIDTDSGEANNSSIEKEIQEFLLEHKYSGNAQTLVSMWNEIFNDVIASTDECIEAYLQLRYGLWFTDREVMKMALSEGLDFIHQLKLTRRACQKSDISFLREAWKEPWYDCGVIDRYADEVNFDPHLLELMRQNKVDTKLLDRYVGDSVALLCCIRLLLADKFEFSDFEQARLRGEVEKYTNARLSSDVDRFACIRPREDFEELVELITNIEQCDLIVEQSMLEKYCEFYYLSIIIKASAQGFLNEDFAENYLKNDLGNLEYIATIYGQNKVDLKLAEDGVNFFDAKIKTDLRVCGIKADKFDYQKFPRAFQCLISSRYGGNLTKQDYRKFLALVPNSLGDRVLDTLNTQKEIIDSFNVFWTELFLEDVGLSGKINVSENASDNIVVTMTNKVRNKYVTQIDYYALDPDAFKEVIGEVYFVRRFSDDVIAVSGTDSFDLNRIRYDFSLPSSLTTWANDEIDVDLLNQFSAYRPIIHANLLKALYTANEKFEMERKETEASESDPIYQISSSALDFFKMDLMTYSVYDKMFYLVSRSPIFIHLFRSKHAKEFLMLFSNAFVYDQNAKRVYMLLYCILKKHYADKFQLLDSQINGLDDKVVMFIQGVDRRQVCYNFKTLARSLDDLLVVASKAKGITLEISAGTILLKFS